MKNHLILLCLLFNLNLFSQDTQTAPKPTNNSVFDFNKNIEFNAGMNRNSFPVSENSFRSASAESKNGYTIQVALEKINKKGGKVRFTLGYHKYGGEQRTSDGGLSYSYSTSAVIDKSVVSLGIFPVIKIFKKIDFNIGPELSITVYENSKITQSSWRMGNPPITSYNEQKHSSKINLGIRGRFAYDIALSGQWSISPQYSYYLGIIPDAPKAHSLRHYFSIGLQKDLDHKT